MGKVKVSTSAEKRESAQPVPAKKPYTKPTLRSLGTVRDLTQTGQSGNPK